MVEVLDQMNPSTVNQKSLKSKRFWKRKNRSRSPSRSVGRSEISEELLTSEEEDCSSISIDDVSTDLSESESVDDQVLEINDSDDESFHSNLLNAEESADDISETRDSLDSQLSWFQEHYVESEDKR